jgi:hypothetical protein
MGGSFTPNEFLEISKMIPIFKNIKIFIETGTHQGDTSLIASLVFDEVFTFEINKIFYEFSKNKLSKLGCNNINFQLGDSVVLLNDLLDYEKRSAFFFLDAHHHFMNTINDIKMDNGTGKTPLLDELIIINNKYPKIPSIICIDDVRLWRNNNIDWSNVNDNIIYNTLNNHDISNVFEFNDRLYFIINNKI